MLSGMGILEEAREFIENLLEDLANGFLFFGTPLELVWTGVDILVTALVIYYVMRLLSDSRAWQLLKGIVLIVVFSQVCILLGLQTVGFVLGNTLSVLAIAFVIIFQPELRRALETVGRSSFQFLASGLIQEETQEARRMLHNRIEAIVRACDRMVETQTGALIVIERQTKLGELAQQENAVLLDAAVSASMLQQIFYKGSPLHDGAVLIRDDRILAARVHIPLSDNYHLRKEYGTRHRAAVGASEMGDAIAIVVSEERGMISVSLEGRLYAMENGDALRTLLHRLLAQERSPNVLTSLLRSRKPASATPGRPSESGAGPSVRSASPPGNSDATEAPEEIAIRPRRIRKRRILMQISSLVLSMLLWLYVQVTLNPVEIRTLDLALEIRGGEVLEASGYSVTLSSTAVSVTLTGRRKTFDGFVNADAEAYILMTAEDGPGTMLRPVQVDAGRAGRSLRMVTDPRQVLVTVEEDIPSD